MNIAASVTTDDGDKVNHGWSQLDIGKHSTNTFIASLGSEDFVCLVTYSDAASVVLDWTPCDEAGIARATEAVNGLRPKLRTNLMAGLNTGFKQLLALPVDDADLHRYALDMIVTTDGMPSEEFNPARGRDGYALLVRNLRKDLVSKRGEVAHVALTAIGLGNSLDSFLLQKMADHFLHMPDPGSVGPFMVNLLAALRCTARLPDVSGHAANNVSLVVSPADALQSGGVPGYTSCVETVNNPDNVPSLRIPLGSVMYDQPRHIMLMLRPGVTSLQVSLDVTGMPSLPAVDASTATPASSDDLLQIEANLLRLRAVEALEATILTAPSDTARITALLSSLEASSAKGEQFVQALKHTLQTEVLLGCEDLNFHRWGVHYLRTLLEMLRCERRSNFRDQVLQLFGRDAAGEEALFEEQSNNAEMIFATLKAPEPSLLAKAVPNFLGPIGDNAAARAPAAAGAPAAPPTVLPAEFMRGGGCFAPASLVLVVRDGEPRRVRIDAVRRGDVVRTTGGYARARCVLLTECAGGRAMLTRLPSGLELTEWHPVLDGGRWRFPLMLGTRVIRRCAHVYNLLLDEGHVLDVSGTRCVTLGHGLAGPVVGHPFWGTEAVEKEMQAAPGWDAGRVVFRPAAQQEVCAYTT